MSEKEILLIGGGGHCRSCIDVIESTNSFKIAGIVEKPEKKGNGRKSILGYPVLGSDRDLENLKKHYKYALITVGQIGTSNTRKKLFKLLQKAGFLLPTIVSPFARVSNHAIVGEGTIVMHQVIVNVGVNVGKNCILNTRSLIEHDVKIGDHAHISTAAVLNGDSSIGSGCFVGSNATIVQGICLPDNYFFKAGSLVANKNDGKLIQDKN